jgi:hypothetical protein
LTQFEVSIRLAHEVSRCRERFMTMGPDAGIRFRLSGHSHFDGGSAAGILSRVAGR